MVGETRRVLHIDSGRRTTNAKKRTAGPPPDNTFFLSSRVKLGSNTLENPYRQHAFFHAAVRRLTSALTVAPFRVLRETDIEGSETAGTTIRQRAWKKLVRRHPKLRPEVFEVFNSKGRKVRKRLLKDFVQTVRKMAPDAPFDLVAKAVGVEVVEEGPWWELFRDVNPELTRSQLWDATTVYLETDGECFWVPLVNGKKWTPPPEPVKNPTSDDVAKFVPTEIWPYGKKGWDPIRDKKKKTLTGWKFELKNVVDEPLIFKANQLGHFKFFDPNNPSRGLAPAEALKIELLQDHNAARYNLGFFERGAQLPWVLLFNDKLAEGDKEDIEDQLLRDYSGVDNSWRPAVFDGGGELKSVGMSQKDMDYYTLRQWVRDEVLAVIGTPKTEMGIFQDSNRASALVSKRVFWDNTILPLMTYYEDNIDSFLFAPVTDGALFGVFDTSMVEALREDLAEKAKVAEVLWKLGFTANEINSRIDLGFEPQEWRDHGWVNQNVIPVETAIKGEAPDGGPESDEDGDGEMPEGGDGEGGDDENDDGDGDGDGDEGGGDAEPDDADPGDDGEGASLPLTRQFDDDDVEAVLLVTTQAERVQRIVDTVRSQILLTLQKGVEEGLTKEQLLDRIREKFNFVTGSSNITSKAGTESSQMANVARSREMRRRGVAINAWLTAGDERVRDDHQTLDGAEGEPGFNFATLLVGRAGVTLEFPLDPRAPADLIVNCRCVLLPRRAPRTRKLSIEESDQIWERYVTRVLDPGEAALKKAIKAIFWRIRGTQLKLIEEAELESHTANSLAFKVEEFKRDLTATSLPIYKEIYANAVEDLEEELAELDIVEPGT